ncbi:MAG: ZIP family metal transporter [Gemmatimonadetes bacterium]|nr:MAG: ZIP family metal transporter [Gemmatimonadota bacterium]
MQAHPLLGVFLFALITALATGLGALPFLFVRTVSEAGQAYASALAGGLMMGATSGLLFEGLEYGLVQTLVGVQAGVAFVLLSSRVLGEHDVSFGEVTGAGARRMLLMVLVMTVHSFSEGVAVGASFAGGAALATFVTVAIAIHNIPEGIAISAVLRPRGQSVARCAGWSVFSSLPQPLMAVPAFLLVEAVHPLLPYAIGFAAGAMLLMVLQELLPEAYRGARRSRVGMLTTAAFVAMLLFQRLI